MDYALLEEEIVDMEDEFQSLTSASVSMTILVMIEISCNSVWAYAVHVEGVLSDAWLPGNIANDLTTVGVATTRVVIKTDTGPAIVDLRRALGASRGGTPTGDDDSRVGDPNNNAQVERTVW